MKNKRIINYDLTNQLRKIILENPDLPIVTLCGSEVNDGDYTYTFATDVTASIGEILDDPFGEFIGVYTDREEFADDVFEYYINTFDGSDREYEEYIEKKLNKYEPYWIKAILVFVD